VLERGERGIGGEGLAIPGTKLEGKKRPAGGRGRVGQILQGSWVGREGIRDGST